jgi:hypothetical protein
MRSNCLFKPMFLTAACLAVMPVFSQDIKAPVPADTVCTRLVEPKVTVPVPTQAEFSATVIIKDGTPAEHEILVVQGLQDRKTQRSLTTAIFEANRQLRCEGFTGKVTRRFVIPATPVDKS